ncbi:MAG: GNAT family N-acetyltransferase [Candidatus Lokiarchaeota archaeon]|nr:GNAT family N-acetyltransferase [Candidatus Lokiarchaeota archaeon]
MCDDMRELIPHDDMYEAHSLGLTHDTEGIKANYANKHLLAWDVFVWANKNNKKYDACGIFLNDKNIKFNCDIFSEYVWISKNPRVGFKILKKAIEFAREKEFDFISLSVLENNPNSEKIENLYKKLGFVKDSTTYLAKL